MLCFRSGRPLHRGDDTDLWLFVIDASGLRGAPESAEPVFVPDSRALTASWTHDQHTYILVGTGEDNKSPLENRAFLEKYLN